MTATNETKTDLSADREIRHVRVFDAPRELVWKALTDPAQRDAWWGPDGFTNTTHKSDLRPGGSWVYTMNGPDGRQYPNAVTFREIVAPERLSYRHGTTEEENPDQDFATVITLEDLGGRTRLTMVGTFKDGAARDFVIREFHAVEGGRQHLEKLADHLARMAGEFVISRTFDAPRALVWRALTDPDAMAAWFGPKGFTGRTIRMDLRPGGVYHYHLAGPGGVEMWARWIYREIVPLERLVFAQSFSDPEGGLGPFPFPGEWPAEMLCTFTLEERAGRTEFTVRSNALDATPAQAEAFKGGFEGMAGGWSGTFDRLVAHLKGRT